MPPSSSRRRASRRQNSEEIEDDPASQSHPMDDIEDHASTQRTKKPKSEKKAKKRPDTQDSDRDDNGSDLEDDEDHVDVSNLSNQPLSRAAETALLGIAKDWEALNSRIKGTWSVVQDVAVSLADARDNDATHDATQEPLEELDNIMRQLLDMSAEIVSHSGSVDDVQQAVARGEAVDDALERYVQGAKQKKSNYAKQTTRQKYLKSESYLEFKSALWAATDPDKPMPPLSEFIDREDGDESDDDDLEIGGQTQDFKCPITLAILEKPMTSVLCKHSFSGEAIKALLSDHRQTTCPAAGCRQRLSLKDCIYDKDLEKRANAYKRRAARRDEERMDDADEIVD